MAAARASEARWQKGAPQGLLDGVPLAIKDTQLTRGWPRLVGSKTIDPNQSWHEDAPATARLRAQNAVFFGKTTTPEFGWKPTTDSPLERRHPQPVEHSSAHRAAAAAAAPRRWPPASVRSRSAPTPAARSASRPSFSGVFGHKPTFGRVAVYPPSAFGDVAHVGPMTRTVDDAALMLDAMKGPDSRDWYSLPDDGIAYRDRVRRRLDERQARRAVADPRLCRAGAGGARGGRGAPPKSSPIWARSSSSPTRSPNRRCRSSRPWRSAGSGR